MDRDEFAASIDHTVLGRRRRGRRRDHPQRGRRPRDERLYSALLPPRGGRLRERPEDDRDRGRVPARPARPRVKRDEAVTAWDDGADEIDLVINVGRLKAGEDDAVAAEISDVVAAVPVPVKVIIETALLSDDEKRRACEAAVEADADMVKTSTGFADGGATIRDVELMSEYLPVKAPAASAPTRKRPPCSTPAQSESAPLPASPSLRDTPGTGTNARQATNLGRGRRRRDRLRASNRRCRRLSPRSRRSLRSPRALRPVAVNLVAVDVDLEGRGHLFGASCDFPAHRCDILDALDRALGRPRLVLGGPRLSLGRRGSFPRPRRRRPRATTTTASSDDDASRTMPAPRRSARFVSRTVAICDSISAAAACVSSARSLTSFATTANPAGRPRAGGPRWRICARRIGDKTAMQRFSIIITRILLASECDTVCRGARCKWL